ncbi:hypothetical protein AWZ03_014249 [Drosophila navojoa]|uniref:Uncharacterized protein n=1 Tax=Drosophila navojoa TaxID=7232 RepID=A0A484ARW3_DRONA|nr:hypothetical protein AWZ03_014249 [Drosophila navojoa]
MIASVKFSKIELKCEWVHLRGSQQQQQQQQQQLRQQQQDISYSQWKEQGWWRGVVWELVLQQRIWMLAKQAKCIRQVIRFPQSLSDSSDAIFLLQSQRKAKHQQHKKQLEQKL